LSLANFYSIRDFALDQHHTICHYDPIDGLLGIHKQVPESGLEMIMFYRISARPARSDLAMSPGSGFDPGIRVCGRAERE